MIEVKNIIFSKTNITPVRLFSCFINHLLPIKLKFKNESFVILEDKKELGLITLDKDSKSYSRFKITKLILEENSTSLARQLVSYVISRYRAMGATSFYIAADEEDINLLNIFKNELHFRHCGSEYLFKMNKNLTYTDGIILKPLKREYVKSICDFYNENINSFNRMLFNREKYQFKNNFQKYVFYNEKEEKILGYFEVASTNNTDFYINFVLDCAYNIYLIDAVKFIYSKLKHKNKNLNLYIKVKDYFLNSKESIANLKENNFELVSKSQVLAKDYYKEIRTSDLLNAKIIFNDPTTA